MSSTLCSHTRCMLLAGHGSGALSGVTGYCTATGCWFAWGSWVKGQGSRILFIFAAVEAVLRGWAAYWAVELERLLWHLSLYQVEASFLGACGQAAASADCVRCVKAGSWCAFLLHCCVVNWLLGWAASNERIQKPVGQAPRGKAVLLYYIKRGKALWPVIGWCQTALFCA